jgi:mannose-6-phosphate isomerase-like protein (cupin superfamily)
MSDNRVGTKLRQLREDRQWTVDDLADQSEVSSGMIQQIEAGDLIPSLTPLLRIARGMGVRLGTFLDDDAHQGPVVVRAGQGRAMARFSGGSEHVHTPDGTLKFVSVAPDKKDRHMEPFLIDVQPSNSEQSETHLSSHEGEEFIYVLEGTLEVAYGKTTERLEAGDSIYYDSVVPHHVRAVGDQPAKILAVVYAPLV